MLEAWRTLWCMPHRERAPAPTSLCFMLQSEHHTLDPEEADYFYVPVYTSCFIHPVWGFVDHPWYYGPTVNCWENSGTQYCATGGAHDSPIRAGCLPCHTLQGVLRTKSWVAEGCLMDPPRRCVHFSCCSESSFA